MSNYAQHFNPTQTPQSEKADPKQQPNSAGGFTFVVDCWTRLERFLILGSEGGSYYASERQLTRDNAQSVLDCCAQDAGRTIDTIVQISDSGRAPKNDPAIFALALAAAHPTSSDARARACAALPKVCRTATHLFQFCEAVNGFRGWGRGLRRAVGKWYTERSAEQLAYQVAKYGNRGKWTHKHLLQLAHAPSKPELRPVFDYIAYGPTGAQPEHSKRKYAAGTVHPYLELFEELKRADEQRTIALIREHHFTHEMIADQHRNSAAVWEALLERMPVGAMIRNLGKMTSVGLLGPLATANARVAQRLTNVEVLKQGRVHPVALLTALLTYQQGHGNKGALTWKAQREIIDGLDAGFYAAFGVLTPSNAATMLAFDVSGSMDGGVVAGVQGLSPRVAAACMGMVTARVEPRWCAIAFTGKGFGGWPSMHGSAYPAAVEEIAISPRQRLDDVVATMRNLPMGGTDCALPMEYATAKKIPVELFVIYTDSETWAGHTHPHQALRNYRQKMGIDAKLAVVGMVSNEFTIADPSDAGMLDLVGFDAAAPQVLADFGRKA